VSALDQQHGGEHYKKFGDYQPWLVLKAWLTPEEFRGYMKGSAIAYLARELDKGKDLDIKKAMHFLQAWVEMAGK
jgi:endo-1,4-beta-mannosidase